MVPKRLGLGRLSWRRWALVLLGGSVLLVLGGSTLHALWGIHRLQAGKLVVQRPRAGSGPPLRIAVGSDNPDWTPLPRIARSLQEAVITAEDDLFWEHDGFNLQQIRESLDENRAEGRIVRGGSTLTMQLARNLFLSRERTWVRKAREAYLTFWLERRLSKQRILEAYLNVAEWGPDVYGIGAAARRYFGKPPARLSVRESALLAMMLPAPKRYARYATAGMTDWSRSMVDDLLLRMRRRGVITQEQYLAACYGCGGAVAEAGAAADSAAAAGGSAGAAVPAGAAGDSSGAAGPGIAPDAGAAADSAAASGAAAADSTGDR